VKSADQLVARVAAVEGTRAVAPRAFGFALVGTEEKSVGAMLVGVDPVAERALGPIDRRVVQGRFLGEAAGEVTVGSGLAEDLDLKLGDTVVAVTQAADGSLGNALYTVVGVHKTGDAQLDRMGLYLRLPDLQDLLGLPDQVHGLTILTDDPDDVDAYTARLREAVGSDVVQVQTWREASPQAAQLMAMSDVGGLILVAIVFGAAAFGVLNTMTMSVFERTRELGVLLAIGLRPYQMVAMIVLESVGLAAVAAAIGLALGGSLDLYLVRHGLDFTDAIGGKELSVAGVLLDPVIHGAVEPRSLVVIVGAVFVVAIGASLWPAFRAARLQPVDAMRAE
jgi:ABC-type lipoprotein release transport system permease subunit